MEYAHPRGEAHQNKFFYTKLAGKLEAEERRSKRLDFLFFFIIIFLFLKKRDLRSRMNLYQSKRCQIQPYG